MPEQTKTFPTFEQIQRRAYEIYLERDGQGGDEFGDWIRAEQELMLSPHRSDELMRAERNEAAKAARRRAAT